METLSIRKLWTYVFKFVLMFIISFIIFQEHALIYVISLIHLCLFVLYIQVEIEVRKKMSELKEKQRQKNMLCGVYKETRKISS